jgi:DNA-binding CsgD family transcriptional regulator
LARGGQILIYDPLRPAPRERNRVIEVTRRFPRPTREFFTRHGLGEHQQMRVLVCDDELLLSYVGGFRRRHFDAVDRDALRALVPALRRMFKIDRRLRDGELAVVGLAAALEKIAAPAFIACRRGGIDHANRAGRLFHDAGPCVAKTLLERVIARRGGGGATDGAEIARLDGPGLPERYLVIIPAPRGNAELERRLATAVTAWKLSRRQVEVIRCIAAGDANKTIADRLGCSPRTIEVHLTNIFRKACVDGRTALVARLHGTPVP